VCGRGALIVYVRYYPVLSSGLQGPSRVSGRFLLCNLLLLLGYVRLVTYYESLWWPLYEWGTGVLLSGFMFVFVRIISGLDTSGISDI